MSNLKDSSNESQLNPLRGFAGVVVATSGICNDYGVGVSGMVFFQKFQKKMKDA